MSQVSRAAIVTQILYGTLADKLCGSPRLANLGSLGLGPAESLLN